MVQPNHPAVAKSRVLRTCRGNLASCFACSPTSRPPRLRAIHNGPLTCRHIRSSISPTWSLTPRSGTNMLIHASSPCSTPVSRRNNEEVCVYCVANAGFNDVLPLSLRASFSHCHDGHVSRRLEARSCLGWGTKNNPPRGFICIV